MIICAWPDGTWCDAGDLCEYLHMSDDFAQIVVADEADEAAIERAVQLRIDGRTT